jgi:predicted regulator of Ras-like GTPase activity (Roadblock/LC7/MglB family)
MFETRGGTIQITDAGELLLVVRSTYQANIGRIRMESGQASLKLAEQIATY